MMREKRGNPMIEPFKDWSEKDLAKHKMSMNFHNNTTLKTEMITQQIIDDYKELLHIDRDTAQNLISYLQHIGE